MRVWIVNPFDDIPCLRRDSGGQVVEGKPQRYWTLAATLADQGHEVVWWSSDWSHRRKARREAPEGVGGPPRPLGTPPESEGEFVESLGTQHPVSRAPNPASLPFTLRLVATPPYLKNISFTRIWNHRKFGRNLYRDACEAIDSGALTKPDVILASLPPMEGPIAALRLRGRYGCRVITDVMDAWPETLLQALPAARMANSEGRMAKDGGLCMRASSFVLRSLAKLMLWPYYRMLRRACRESDAVSAQSETFADFAKQHGATGDIHVCYLGAQGVTLDTNPICGGWGQPPSHDVREGDCPQSPRESVTQREGDCPQSPDRSDVEAREGDTLMRAMADSEGRRRSAEAGEAIAKDEPSSANEQPRAEKFQDTAIRHSPSAIRDYNKLRLLYLGAMGRSYDLDTILDALQFLAQEGLAVECVFVGDGEKRAKLEARQVAGVRFTGFLQGEALEHELRSADVGMVPFFPQSGVAVPYKAGDYLAYGLPLLSTIEGELAELVQRFHCGMTYPVLNPQALADAIRQYAHDRERLSLEQRQAKACFDAHFDRAKTYPEFAKWMLSASPMMTDG